eukprot:CAMPEP_0172503658 /NCGR_PEP_ID=MMETSP1066-20121228/171178_1 /TAXON_ID=671091 /ORGANISM="Coscinodiscus wailesii, Strain CCMP2513" /LENGTH=277 /DNA_ID=CAMNT_0013279477 /DNA_START=199 /DNA_END=1028 /DNA_ORIENTATION=+
MSLHLSPILLENRRGMPPIIAAVAITLLLLLQSSLFLVPTTDALSHHHVNTRNGNRRSFIGSAVVITPFAIAISPLHPDAAAAAAAMSPPPPPPGTILRGAGGTTTRVEGIGGGFDLSSSTIPRGTDVIYPASISGTWKCRRRVTSVEGDVGQAEIAWGLLGGTDEGVTSGTAGASPFRSGRWETFESLFVLPPEGIRNEYVFEGKTYAGVVLDRGAELTSRKRPRGVVSWNVASPGSLSYDKNDGGDRVEIVAVQRKVELPSEAGFGYNELYRISS